MLWSVTDLPYISYYFLFFSLRSICLTFLLFPVENGLETIKHGWKEYKHQPVLPASVATVLLYFNVALAPGAIMTALLMHHGKCKCVTYLQFCPYDSGI